MPDFRLCKGKSVGGKYDRTLREWKVSAEMFEGVGGDRISRGLLI